MITLLDVNVLIALCDVEHEHHEIAAHRWHEIRNTGWATCPLTELGLLRIYGNPKYPRGPGNPKLVASLLRQLRAMPGYVFWPDSVSPADASLFLNFETTTSAQLTDIYLLALAVKNGGRLATFDSKINPALIAGGKSALTVILA